MSNSNIVEDMEISKEAPKRRGVNIKEFIVEGVVSKPDPLGIIDENIKIRQILVREMLSDLPQALADKETLQYALKAMSDNDKSVVSMARIKVDEEGNKNAAELARAIVAAAVGNVSNEIAASVGKDESHLRVQPRQVDLPPMSRELVVGELEVGTRIVSHDEILKGLSHTASSDSENEDED